MDSVAPDDGPNFLSELKRINPNVILVFFRNKNKNVVVYEAKKNQGNVEVEVYWLEIDPEYRKVRRSQGINHDRVELSLFEKSHAFGVTTVPINQNESHLRFNAENSYVMRVVMNDNGSKLMMVHNGILYRFRSANVVAGETFNIFPLSNIISHLCFNVFEEKTKKPFVFDRQRDGSFTMRNPK